VRAFFGLCTLTEALEGTTVLDDRLTDWWHLTLPSLRPQPSRETLPGTINSKIIPGRSVNVTTP
jgi:hypothetical protein